MDGHKRPKLCQEQDILSSLPDCVLTHILSFLPTKDAVSTCILSTRWRDLWAGVPSVDLDDKLLYFHDIDFVHSYEYVPFMDFVDRILYHRGASNMTKFRLSCVVCFCPSRVSSWISFAIGQNVQELDLCLDLEIPFALPQCVFNCPSIRVLKIDMECVLMLPQMVSLPNLKTLYLALVEFSDEESTHKLFSSSPVLEELYLLDCDWRRLDIVTISMPKLRKLRFDDLLYPGSLNGVSDSIIELEAPNLMSFSYIGNLSNEIILLKSPLLVEASISLHIEPERIFDAALRVIELLDGVQNVKILTLSNDAIESLFLAERFLGWLPVFQKLTHMEVIVETDNGFRESLLEILRNLPHLEVLALSKGR